MKKNISLFTVKKKDLHYLFHERNEISARINSIEKKQFTFKGHVSWFNKRIKKKPVLFWILKKKRQNIGYIRLDRKLNKYYLSYLISKNHRDKKYGTSIIEMMLKKKEVKIILEKKFHLIAVSKKKNKKSISSLLKNNFNQIYKSRNTLTLQYDNS